MRLICPGCAAQYRLPENAIPAEGREVECTACGHVWQARRLPVPQPATDREPQQKQAAFGPTPEPPREDLPAPSPAEQQLSRKLPDSVLNILRGEVEHERRARMAEDTAFGKDQESPRPMPDPAQPDIPVSEGDWPATTVVTPAGGAAPAPEPPQGEKPQAPRPPVRIPAAAAAAATTGAATAATTFPGKPAPAPVPEAQSILTDDQPPQPLTLPPTAPEADGAPYRQGLAVAAMVTGIGLALYLLAPVLADAGPLGDALGGLRRVVDEGRLWLQAQVGIVAG
ncbi:zinc-ribbon domain-containing protein [Paracoccus sp. XHP0099]|uniref:Zinc-ribbon domain-containing protein n=1 Tax=Paracoccus marinaquae TaxID=2841926 RepID=A0ABS6AEF9_9RHOB|nr:zinc-ribbon domain-containing protein [Paracoccus marinaquae]